MRRQDDVDAQRVAGSAKEPEELRVGSFLLEGIGDVGVARHRHEDATVPVADGVEVWNLLAPLGGVTGPLPGAEVRNLRHLGNVELRAEERIAGVSSSIGYSPGGNALASSSCQTSH